MNDTPSDAAQAPVNDAELPRHLRVLRGLVTALTVTMILGVIAVVAVLVIRLNTAPAPILITEERFELPEGVAIIGFAQLSDSVAIIGDDHVLRQYDSDTGALIREVDLSAAQ